MARLLKRQIADYASDDFHEEQAQIMTERKTEALSPDHDVKPHYGYKKQKENWLKATEEMRHAYVYGMVMFDGAIAKGANDIARFFGVQKKDLVPYLETFEMAKAALKLKIQRNTISLGLQREDMVVLKFNLLKQYAEQIADPAHEGVEPVQTTPPQIVINAAQGANDELRAELDAAVQAAMTVNRAKTVQ